MANIARLALDMFSSDRSRLIDANGAAVISRVIPMAKPRKLRARTAGFAAYSETMQGLVYAVKGQPLFETWSDAKIFADAHARKWGELTGHVVYIGKRA